MRAVLLIATKDLAQRIRDRSAILLGLVAPLGLALIFSGIIPDTSSGSIDVSVAVVDNDGGEISATFIDEVLPAVAEQGVIEIVAYDDTSSVLADVEDGYPSAAYVFPPGFTDAVRSGSGATVQVVGNVDQGISTQIARAILDGYVAEVDAVGVAVGAAVINGATDVDSIAAGVSAAGAAAVVTEIEADTRELDATTFFAAGMAVFFLFFTVQFGVSSLLEERHHGTLPRLLGAPISRWSILGGKAATSFVLGLVSMVVLAVATTLLIGAQWGNPIGVGVLMVSGVLAALGIMAVVAVIAKTPEQAANWQSIIAVALGLLGGTFFPLSQGPRLLSLLSKLTPHAWFMEGMGDLSVGGDLSVVVVPALAMIAFALVTVGVAFAFGREVLAP